MKNYTYPRVDTKIIAKIHNTAAPEAEDTTVLFMPILADKGPMNEIVKVHSLEEFITIFGEMDGIKDRVEELTAFNIMNWLTAGGTLYVVRLGNEAKSKPREVTIEYRANSEAAAEYYTITGKDIGAYINDYTFDLVKKGEGKQGTISVKLNNRIVERVYFEVPTENSKEVPVASEYIKSIKKVAEKPSTVDDGGTDGLLDGTKFTDVLKVFWGATDKTTIDGIKDARDFLENPLPTPIDLLMDAGYPVTVKAAMANFVLSDNADEPGSRPDIRAYIDLYDNEHEKDEIAKELPSSLPNDENVFYFWQSFTISDAVFADGKDMTVGPSYFLSKIIPANDIANGIQFAAAGTRRAELTDVVKMSENPLPDTKETLFNKHINYAEKDSKGYYFMSQRTSSKLNTALSHINCSRVTCRMVHEINALARDYLFEFNDATTLQNMRSVLNKYITNWIANRTLSYGEVDVAKNALSDEAVDVTLNIKFTGTIEVISIKLIIE